MFRSMTVWGLLWYFHMSNHLSLQASQLTTTEAFPYRIVNAGTNFTLKCEKRVKGPLQWHYPSTYINPENYVLSSEKPLNQRSISTSVKNGTQVIGYLNVSQASYLDTGLFTCRDNTYLIIAQEFVFVQDRLHLMLPPVLEMSTTIGEASKMSGWFSQSNLTIGCAPTNPTVTVELRKLSGSITGLTSLVASSAAQNVANWSFSPFYGFTLKTIHSWDLRGRYECAAFEMFDSEISHPFEMEIYGVEVFTAAKGPTFAGSPFEITCRGRKQQQPGHQPNMRLSWQWVGDDGHSIILDQNRRPPGTPEMNEGSLFDDVLGLFQTRTIKWQNIPSNASGFYACHDLDDDTVSPARFQVKVIPDPNLNDVRGPTRSSWIQQEDSVTFQAGKSFSLSCIDPNADPNVSWEKPRRADDDDYYKRYNVVESLRKRSSVSQRYSGIFFSSVLTVTNASFLDTGYYSCHRSDGSKMIQRWFVYVEDPINLIRPAEIRKVGPTQDLRVIGYYHEHNVSIGCGPTHPSVQVVLKKQIDDDYKILSSSQNQNDPESDYIFDPFEGFKIKMVDSWEMKGQHICEGRSIAKGTKTTTPRFKLKIQGVEIVPLDVSSPIYEGDELTLTCRSKNKDAMQLSWRWLPFSSAFGIHLMDINASQLPAGGSGYWLPFEEDMSEKEYRPMGTFQVHRLKWRNVPIEAAGIYQCYDAYDLTIPFSNMTIQISSATAPSLDDPQLQIVDVKRGNETKLVCRDTTAVPKPKIQWFHRNGKKIQEIGFDKPQYYAISTNEDGHSSELTIFSSNSDAKYFCRFSTWKGQAEKNFTVNVHDPSEAIEIVSSVDFDSIFVNENLTLTCRSQKKEAMNLSWQWIPFDRTYGNGAIDIHATQLPAGGDGYLYPFENETSDQELSPTLGVFKVHNLRWEKIPIDASGIYLCYDANDLTIAASNVTLLVSSSSAPSLENPDNQQIEIERGTEIFLECRDNAGRPKPQIRWFKTNGDNEEEIKNDRPKYYAINTTNDGHVSQLAIHYPSSSAKYRCHFSNRDGEQVKYFDVKVYGLHKGIVAAIVIVAIVVLVIIFFIARFVRSSHQQKQIYQELINNRLKLLEGNLERIDRDKPLEDQLDLLPYDTKFEFPLNHLVLGKQLGAGQFGRVVQAKAVGMGPGNTTVAVKMVKSQTDNIALASLASELKILIHLGCHMNVVNLLGACTKNLIKGELLVIVEFCKHGNLQDYLLANRSNFINELEESCLLPSSCQIEKSFPRPPLVRRSTQNAAENDPTKEVHEKSGRSRYWFPVKTTLSTPDSPIICTHDLMNWSYQVACGMNYLTKLKVLHGDLAARNVLLADDDVVKIADFGLSRQVYKDCNYQKQGQEALPVKWMAIESLLDRVFSSQSDVWSFGVTLWEFFTLSQQPFPEVMELVDLIRLLRAGHRMEKPEYAPDGIGKIMTDCWLHNPEERPTFNQLEETLGLMVDEVTRQRYANLQQANYMHMTRSVNENANPQYMRMTSAEETAQHSVYQNLAASSKLPKIFPELSGMSNYVNTARDDAPLDNQAITANQQYTDQVAMINSEEASQPTSPTSNLSDMNYLPMHPATPL